MSFWGHFVSSLSDSGRSFLESTAKDISEFSSSLKEETKDLHLPSLPSLPLPSTTSHKTKANAAVGGTEGKRSEGEGSEGHNPEGEGEKNPPPSLQPQSSTSSSSSLSSLGQKVFHFLPSFITSESSSVSSSFHSTVPLPLSSSSSSSPVLLTLLRSRSTYTADPIDPSTSSPPLSYSTFSSTFRAAFASTPSPYADDISALLRLPTVHRLHEELVGGGEVDEVTFWCRVLYQRGKIEEEDKKRAKLQSRLNTIQRHSSSPTAQSEKDDLAWGDDEEEEEEEEKRGKEEAAAGGEGGGGETAVEAEVAEEEEEQGEGEEEEEVIGGVGADAGGPSLSVVDSQVQPVVVSSSVPASSSTVSLSFSASSDADDDSNSSSSAAAAMSFLDFPSPSPVNSVEGSEESEGSGEFVDKAEILEDIQNQQRKKPLLNNQTTQQQQQQQQQQHTTTTSHNTNNATTTTATAIDKDDLPHSTAALPQLPEEEDEGEEGVGGKEEVRSSVADTIPVVEEDYDEWE